MRVRARRRAARAPRRSCSRCRRPIRGLVEALRWSGAGELTHEACEVSPRGVDGRELSIATMTLEQARREARRGRPIIKQIARHRAGIVAVPWTAGLEDANRIDAAAFMRRVARRGPRQPRLPRSVVPSELECGHWQGTQVAMRWGLEPLCRLEPCASIVRRLHVPDVATRVRRGHR